MKASDMKELSLKMALKLVDILVKKGLIKYEDYKTKTEVNAEIRRMILEGTISPTAEEMKRIVNEKLSPFSDEAKSFTRILSGAKRTITSKKSAAKPKKKVARSTKKKAAAKPRKKKLS